jgi:hypothetical protein
MTQKTGVRLMIPLGDSRWKLLKLWFSGFAVILAFLIYVSLLRGDVHREDAAGLIGWAFPNLLPTLSLIATVVGANAINPPAAEPTVRKQYHQLVYWVSFAYLFLVALPLFTSELTTWDVLEATTISNLWLGPIQGVVGGLIAVLFNSKTYEAAPTQQPSQRGLEPAGSEADPSNSRSAQETDAASQE